MYHVKRPREEDFDLDGVAAATKRIRTGPFSASPPSSQTLPFRSSPTSQHTTLFSTSRAIPKPPALTPASESDSDSDIEFHSPTYQPKVSIPTLFSTDADAEMDDADTMTSPVFSPKTSAIFSSSLASPPIASSPYPQLLTVNSSAARVPTPIYGHFNTLQRTTLANASSPTAADPPPAGVVRTTNEQHDAFLRRRRLPSPICEDSPSTSSAPPLPSPMTQSALRSPTLGMAMQSPTALDEMQSLGVRTPMSATFAGSTTATPLVTDFARRASEGGRMDSMHSMDSMASASSAGRMGRHDSIESAVRTDSTDSTMSGSSGSVSSPSGRRRSDAVSGGQHRNFVFSMGFRADCVKCRERVPGHYSHVLRV